MNAKYFYNRLLGYDEESMKARKWLYDYCNGSVDIHRIDNEDICYTIWKNGSISVKEKGAFTGKKLSIDDLSGDDFELYSIVQNFKCGYLLLPTASSERDVKMVISNFHHTIESFEDDYGMYGNKNIPVLCGGSSWTNGLTDGFEFYASNDIEVHLSTIHNICDENVMRKYYDAKCFPFIKDIKNTEAIYVQFVDSAHKRPIKETIKKCNEALKELISYCNIDDIKWVNCKMRKPIYS